MGGLSRKRRQPRIVKKARKPKTKRKLNPESLDQSTCSEFTKMWDSKKTVSSNYEKIGIARKVNLSMRQTAEGKTTLTEARIHLNRSHYEKKGTLAAEIEDNQQEYD